MVHYVSEHIGQYDDDDDDDVFIARERIVLRILNI